ncbi:MAG: tetratricopeptide repeat protein [Gemmatimonadota bacterium]
MSKPQPIWGRFCIASGFILFSVLGNGMMLDAQQLPLKRGLPGSDSIACPQIDLTVRPSPEEVDQASRMGSDADQALMLGNQERARDLLARATELDPTSAELAYRYGRSLESLDETEPAIEQFCRALALGSREQGIGDARPRLEALARAREPELSEGARSQFLNGLLQADLGNLQGAEEAFGAAFLAASDWADAVYNRGIIRIRLGLPDPAVEDLQQYLALRPDADDAILVSQRIGQLQIRPSSSVSAGTALGLGLVIPGMGQFYSGRALGGFSVLALAGGAIAAGFLIEEVQVKCVGSPPSSGECPPDRFISEETSNPYKMHGLAAAGVVAVIGAVEAYFKAKRPEPGDSGEIVALDVGPARVLVPSLSARGPRLNLNLVRVTF